MGGPQARSLHWWRTVTEDGSHPPLRLGVLAPLIAGPYMTGLMHGAVRAAHEANARLIALQTLDPGTWGSETIVLPAGQRVTGVPEPPSPPLAEILPRYSLRTAWDLVAGFLIVLGAVTPTYMRSLRQAGKPVVLVSHNVDGFAVPTVRIDNRSGMMAAVSHLIEHGHRRIAFAGCLQQADTRDRLDAYHAALTSHGLSPDPQLLFTTADNLEGGGEVAGRRMLDAGLPSTAVVAATDYNAIGIMRVFTEAGLSLPGDQAIVGFDDVPASSSTRPALSTVHQSSQEVGAMAAQLLLGLVHGRDVPAGCYLIPTHFIARESCGCSPRVLVERVLDPVRHGDHNARDRFRNRLTHLLLAGGQVTEAQATACDRAVQLISGIVEPDGGSAAPIAEGFPEASALLCMVSPRWATVSTAVACLRQYWEDVCATGAGSRTQAALESGVSELTIELCRAIADFEAGQRTELQLITDQEHDLNSALIRGSSGDPRSLRWLGYSLARSGCLGLWSTYDTAPGERAALDIVGSYARDVSHLQLPARVAVEQFPPEDLLDDTGWEPDELTVVLPTMTPTTDLGLLAIVTPVHATEVGGRDRLFDKGSLLGLSLERHVMANSSMRYGADDGTVKRAMADDARAPLAALYMWPSVAGTQAGVSEKPGSALRTLDPVVQVGVELTPSEELIVRLIADGLADKMIAVRLGMSYRTVRTHLERLYERAGLHSRAEAVRLLLLG
jgi:DNA-binding CsgD family transcriptional regulator